MEDDRVGPDPASRLHRGAKCRQRVRPDCLVAAREIDEIERVARNALDAGLSPPLTEPVELLP